MRKTFSSLWMLLALPMLLGVASCSDDSPAPASEGPQMADYTIIYYGHGGANLDFQLLTNMTQFYAAAEESYKNVNIVAQYKFSSLQNMQEVYKQYAQMLSQYVEPGTPDYEEALKDLDIFTAYYPYAGKTARFVVDRQKPFVSADEDGSPTQYDESLFIDSENADVTRADSLANFINWAAKTSPARKYILVLSDHGGGYLPNDELPEAASPAAAARQTRGLMYDDSRDKHHFTAKTLTEAIQQATVRPSVVYLDACMMNTAEYQFELAPTTDYLVLSTFVVPGEGGKYTALIDALSANPDDLEQALTRFTKATVEAWDKTADRRDSQNEPVYHDMSVYRTSAIDALGAEIKTFTDRLTEAYQNGSDEVRAKIDTVTAHAYRINESQPEYDLIDYAATLTFTLPGVFGSALDSPLGQAFDRCIVYQQSSRWLQENEHAVDLSVLLCCQGHFDMDYGILGLRFDADGQYYMLLDGQPIGDAHSWGSTLDETYGRLRFDQKTGWSRWLRLNRQEPNAKCYTGYNPFANMPLPDEIEQTSGRLSINKRSGVEF